MTKTTIAYPIKISNSKFENNKLYYFVEWRGYRNGSWEPVEHIEHRQDLISSYKEMCILENLWLDQKVIIGYCRVSTKDQAMGINGNRSLEQQKKIIEEWCAKNKYKCIEIVTEYCSGKNLHKMRGLKYAFDKAGKGVTIAIVEIDRLIRNMHHALNLLEDARAKGIDTYSIQEKLSYSNDSDRNQFRIQLCGANYTYDVMRTKMLRSVEFRRNRGDIIGRTPFGFDGVKDDEGVRRKIANSGEMKIIKAIKDNANIKTEDILDMMIKKGYTFRNGKVTISGIDRIIYRLHHGDLVNYSFKGKAKAGRRVTKKTANKSGSSSSKI